MVQGFASLNYFGLLPSRLFRNGLIALVLVYTAYVSEVYRAGIESVHPSQRMAARSLGLSYMQTMRYVVLPQAIRRVIPPLLNDFIGLQKDTALVTIIGVTEAPRRRGFYPSDFLNDRRLRRRGRVLHLPHDPARALHRQHHQEPGAAGAGAGRMSTNGHFVSLQGVTKRFGDLEVLHGIDLDVGEHNVVCLIGASGSGKSTLLRCINLLEQVDDGTIVVDGQTVTGMKVDVNKLRQKIGIVFQAYNLFPHMTVLQNLTLAPRKALGISRDKANAHARALLRRSASRTRPTSSPTGSRAASSSAWRSCARLRQGRSSCCSTRSPRRSTRS